MKKRSSNQRSLYKKWHGNIPKDEFGRTYDIHHIDGNHENNSFENLVAIPIKEHYNIHYQNKDWGACAMIAVRLHQSPEEISELISKAARKRVDDGTHYWLTKEHSENVRKRINKAVEQGTYHMLGGKIQKEFQLARSQSGQHQWNGSSSNITMLQNGTHPSQQSFVCTHCGTAGKGSGNAKRWHFDNCKKRGYN